MHDALQMLFKTSLLLTQEEQNNYAQLESKGILLTVDNSNINSGKEVMGVSYFSIKYLNKLLNK